MSNHFHIVVYLDPLAPQDWDALDVARRWTTAFRPHRLDSTELFERHVRALADNESRIKILRQRLGSLSWFMRCINEPIARMANREDGCTGRFWEGRYKCQALLDEQAILSCMTYVDLNPLRAKVSDAPELWPHTSARQRALGHKKRDSLEPVLGCLQSRLLALSETDYLKLLDWTGRVLHPGKRGVIDDAAPPVLDRLHVEHAAWCRAVRATESGYWRVIGSAYKIRNKATEIGQQWLCGLSCADAGVGAVEAPAALRR
jgi:hypothetical protein